MAENLIAQEIRAYFRKDLYYWQSQGTAEVDFVLQLEEKICPIEVKSGRSIRSKSLQVYRKKYEPKLAVRFSALLPSWDESKELGTSLVSLPLYLVAALGKL